MTTETKKNGGGKAQCEGYSRNKGTMTISKLDVKYKIEGMKAASGKCRLKYEE